MVPFFFSSFSFSSSSTSNKNAIISQLHNTQLEFYRQSTKLINLCRARYGLDPIMSIPMFKATRSKLLRWRLGWLPTGYNTHCNCGSPLTKSHAIICHDMHFRLRIKKSSSDDPLSFLLNKLPRSPPQSHRTISKWQRSWPTICQILLELELLQHPNHLEPPKDTESDPFLDWLSSSPWLALNPPPPLPTW